MIHRCSRGAFEHNTGCVVGAVNEPAPGPFDVLDTRIVGLDLACRGTGNDEDLDLFPPPACEHRVAAADVACIKTGNRLDLEQSNQIDETEAATSHSEDDSVRRMRRKGPSSAWWDVVRRSSPWPRFAAEAAWRMA